MTNLPKNLPDLLRKAGLKVVTIDGYETRGRPASTGGFGPVGVLNHHTAAHDILGDFEDDLSYAKWMFLTGRPADGLPAPLVQLALSLEGTVYVGALGRSNHAGAAKASGSVASGDGNYLYVGIEWMLSGYQPIPKAMYEAGATLNAVLLDLLGSSVQAMSCHYQTSVTGKWDIGDPNGVPFGNNKVLNVPKFRAAVADARKALNAEPEKPEPASTVLKFQHTSMQFSDNDRQMARDAERIFSRGRHILTGTEAGGLKAQPLPDLLKTAANKYGYRLHLAGVHWIAVDRELVTGRWDSGYVPVLQVNEGTGPHLERGIGWVSFDTADLGRITVGTGHYLTKGRAPGDPNFDLNREYAAAVGDFARDKGKGEATVFYAGDQNIVDRTEDTFFGSPLTSAWDEMDRYQNTGHGNIDVIASYDRDGRVEAKGIRALSDKTFHLHTDHYLVEAEYTVRHIKEKS